MGKHSHDRAQFALTGAAVTAAAGVMVVATTGLHPILSVAVEPTALVIQGSSTNPGGDGIKDFYGGAFSPVGTEIESVNFFFGPLGIDQAVRGNGDPDDVVMSSGWGAANASLLMSILNITDPDDPALTGTSWVLDNNVARPNGGYGTRYPIHAAIGVNPLPTPADVDAKVLDVGYQYDVNSNAPAYPANLVAVANSFAAYFAQRLNQSDLELPAAARADMDGTDADPDQHWHFIVDPATGDYDAVPVDGNVTYVTYLKDGLPLVAPLRMLPGGDAVADTLEPVLTVAVNAGYPDNDPLSDPSVYRPAGLVPMPDQLLATAQQLPGAVEQGITKLQDHMSGGTASSARASVATPAATAADDDVAPTDAPKQRSGTPKRLSPSVFGRDRPVLDAVRTTLKDVRNNIRSTLRGGTGAGSTSSADTGSAD